MRMHTTLNAVRAMAGHQEMGGIAMKANGLTTLASMRERGNLYFSITPRGGHGYWFYSSDCYKI